MTAVTMLIAAYNEGPSLEANLVRLADYLSLYAAEYRFDYVIVDDGSTDETLQAARHFAKFRANAAVISHPRNAGLGSALRTGFACAGGEYVVTLDADMSYPPQTAIALLEAIREAGADIALASPYMPGGSVRNVPPLRRLLSREANRVLSLATSGRYRTLTCMVRAYRTAFITRLQSTARGMEINSEIVFRALKSRSRIVEIPAHLHWSDERRSEGGRAKPRRLIAQTWSIFRESLAFRPSLWLAIPGLFPGLLPLVVGVLLLLHAPARTIAIGTAITVTIQYASIAIFAGQLTTFAAASIFGQKHRPPAKALRS